jgi:hypothetical protein
MTKQDAGANIRPSILGFWSINILFLYFKLEKLITKLNSLEKSMRPKKVEDLHICGNCQFRGTVNPNYWIKT